MSTTSVLRIEDYRDRRSQRLRIAESLCSTSTSRSALLGHLVSAASISGADRAAVVWVDEYGAGLVHPHVILDLLSDRPRRAFSAETLKRAWELGVPAALDEPSSPGADMPSSVSVSLGSDGTRAWFLVAESLAPRPPLDAGSRDRIMFLSGECSALVLHRDLDAMVTKGADDTETHQVRFAGWPVLRDMEGRDADEAVSARISKRFVVARLARMLVDDDLTLPADRIADQVRRARDEISSADPQADRETHLWFAMLDAFESMQMDEIAGILVSLGEEAEAEGHHNGALELYRCAYAIAAAVGFPAAAIDAARLSGRVSRRRAEWDKARDWYGAARLIALEVGLEDRLARTMAGLASIDRERGNLPAARNGLLEALPIAASSGDGNTLGAIYHDLLAVERDAGDLPSALEYGWLAVTSFVSADARVRGLASLAGALVEAGEYQPAEDAWTVVAHHAKQNYYRVFGWDALAYLASLRKDGDAFDIRAARCDALGWESGQPSAKSQILYYRGLSCRELGRFDDARRWLERAVAFCEEHGFGRTLFLAEDALKSLHEDVAAPVRVVNTPPELILGLREMRVEMVGTGV
jgi:tetratricopeptide (TPR) repeat protein